jgi:SAM-dependent methyltransferase
VSGTGLTDEPFWRSYWASKDVVRSVDESDHFYPLLRASVGPQHRSFVELGGYPGRYAVLARKYLGLEVTLVDLVVEPALLERLLSTNGIPCSEVAVVQTDFFDFRPEEPYDVVFSSGVVEHFEEPERVLAAHAELAAPGGLVLVTIPNFRGLNGLLQRCFDRENLAVHNLEVMDRARLLQAASGCGLERPEAFYYGGLEVWLERIDERSRPLRWLVRAVNGIGRRLPDVNGRLTSGHLVLRAWKPSAGA